MEVFYSRIIEKGCKIGSNDIYEDLYGTSSMVNAEVQKNGLVIVTEDIRVEEGSRIMPGDFVHEEVGTVLS